VRADRNAAEAIALLALLALTIPVVPRDVQRAYATEVTEFFLPGVPPATPTPSAVTVIQRDVRCPSPSAQSPGIYFVESAIPNKIGRLAFFGSDGCPLVTPTFTEWTVPTPGALTSSSGIAANPDGIVVAFTETAANKIGFLNAQTNQIIEFQLPVNGQPTAITWVDGDRAAFLMPATNQIGIFNRAINTFIFFTVPTGGAGLAGISPERPNAVWFTESNANKIARLDLVTRVIIEYTLPVCFGGANGPTGILVDKDGFVWTLGASTGAIFKLNPATSVFRCFFTPTITGSQRILNVANDTQGGIWFTESDATNGNRVGRLQGITNTFTEFNLLTAGAAPTGIAFEIASNAIWFTNSGSHTLGRIITPGPVQVFTGGQVITTTTQPGPAVTVSTGFLINSAITSTATSATASALLTSATTSAGGPFTSVTTATASSIGAGFTATTLTDTQVVLATSTASSDIVTTFATAASVTFTSTITTSLNTTATTTIPLVIPTSTTVTQGTTFTTVRPITIIPGFPAESMMVGGMIAVLAIFLLRARRRYIGRGEADA